MWNLRGRGYNTDQKEDTHGWCKQSSSPQGCRGEREHFRFSKSLWQRPHHGETAGKYIRNTLKHQPLDYFILEMSPSSRLDFPLRSTHQSSQVLLKSIWSGHKNSILVPANTKSKTNTNTKTETNTKTGNGHKNSILVPANTITNTNTKTKTPKRCNYCFVHDQ